MKRKTKIIATIGPASQDKKTLAKMIGAGMDIARLNFSHGDLKTHKQNILKIRKCEHASGKAIGIMADLCGPKIRTGKMEPMRLDAGDKAVFAPEESAGNGEIPVTYPNLASDLCEGNRLLLDDGRLAAEVIEIKNGRIFTKVIDGGILSEHKGINLPGVSLSTSALTEKDVEDLVFALSMKVDFVAISFVQRAHDIQSVRKIMRREGRVVPIVAKIERQTAIRNIDTIIKEADAVMIARGDLGVETPLEKVPILQKQIIAVCAKYKRPAIVATQMLESMIEMERPTRAEVSDVANSVFDGADVVMLSAETASGRDPANAIATMSKIINASEDSSYLPHGTYDPDEDDDTSAIAITRAACFAAEEAKARAICVFTMTGRSALFISKQRPNVDVIAITNDIGAERRLSLCWGVRAVRIPPWRTIDAMTTKGVKFLKARKLIESGDRIVIVSGMATVPGATNMIKVLEA